MPFAADQIHIIPRPYPVRASGDVHAVLYRICILIYSMACGWKHMRAQGYFTVDMAHLFHNLAPLALDITQCLDTFTRLLATYVRDSTNVNLSG